MRLAAFALLGVTAFAQAPPGIVGRWRTLGTTKGGIGSMFEFHDDGTLSYSLGAVVEMNYRIEGNQLIFPPGTVNGPEQHQTIKWVNADRLVLNKTETLSRQGAARDANNPILGEWTAPRDMDGVKLEARYFFEPAGKSLLLLPFAWQKGTYAVKGATIRMAIPKASPIEGSFRIEGDVLTMPKRGGAGESQLRRY